MTQIANLPILSTSSSRNISVPVVDLNSNPGISKRISLDNLVTLAQGPQGPQGVPGIMGFQGFTGSVGAGYTGSASTVAGFTGSRGSTGTVGFTGSIGSTGTVGFTGSQGPGANQSLNTTSTVKFSTVTFGDNSTQTTAFIKGVVVVTNLSIGNFDLSATALQGNIFVTPTNMAANRVLNLPAPILASGSLVTFRNRDPNYTLTLTYNGYNGVQITTVPVSTSLALGCDNSAWFVSSSGGTGNGYVGSAGFTGSQGPAGGFTGSTGFTGSFGYVGSQGPAGGYTGSQGTTGFVGSSGFTGSGGIGFTGSTGYVGSPSTIPGFVGSAGSPGGYTGSQGINGYTGSAGLTGFVGSAGSGYTGSASTATGYTGSAGAGYTGSASTQPGATGFTGSLGLNGYTGSKGDIGFSGSVGFTGSGGQGFTGSTGAGFDGSRGATGFIGSAGLLGFTGSLGYTGSASTIPGFVGSAGSPGGYTGSAGSTGVAGGVTYSVVNSGSSSYTIAGSTNPTLTLIKGFTYYFNVSATGHPFWIKTSAVTGTGSSYSSGVTNNGVDSGTVAFTVPFDAPSTLYYICQFHGGMVGTITVLNSMVGFTGSAGLFGFTGSAGTGGTNGFTGSGGFTGSAGVVNALANGTYTITTLYVSTLTVTSVGAATISSANDLNLKAVGQITVNKPFVLTTATMSQLAALGATTQRGAMVYVTDATGGEQPCYFNGTNWFTVNGRTQIA